MKSLGIKGAYLCLWQFVLLDGMDSEIKVDIKRGLCNRSNIIKINSHDQNENDLIFCRNVLFLYGGYFPRVKATKKTCLL